MYTYGLVTSYMVNGSEYTRVLYTGYSDMYTYSLATSYIVNG